LGTFSGQRPGEIVDHHDRITFDKHLNRRSNKMKTPYISPPQDRLSDAFLLDLFDTTMTNSNWKRNSNRRQYRAPFPPQAPPFLSERPRFSPNGGPRMRPQNQRVAPYQIPMRQLPPNESRPPRHVLERPPDKPTPQHNNNRTPVIPPPSKQSLTYYPKIRPSPPNPSPSNTSSRENPPTSPPPSGKPAGPREPWRIQLCLEKERLLIPAESKPSALLFFTTDITKPTRESKSDPRNITKVYRPDELFGTAPARKVHLREIPVTFSQIWNRHTFIQKWTRHGQDHQGYLQFENKELKIQMQRHHVPGTFFTASEAGDYDINDDSITPPDVCFRMVDAPGQDFSRLDSIYDLKRIVELEDGEREITFKGVDGKEIKVEIAETNHVRIPGAGMPRTAEGGNRGDLIVEVVRSQ